MFGLICAAVALAMPPRAVMQAQASVPLTGPGAVATVDGLLTRFGITGPFRAQKASSIMGDGKPPWHVTVTDARGSRFEAVVGRDPGWISIWRGKEQVMVTGQGPRAPAGGATERIAKRLLAAVHTTEPTRQVSLTEDGKGQGRAYFSILRKGYPFVSRPKYGYQLGFTTPGGEFLWYRSEGTVPPVDPTPPKLDTAGALAALKRIWDTEVVPEAINKYHALRTWYTLMGEPELGYYRPDGRATAILVWRIAYMHNYETRFDTRGGDNAMLINAVTGERIPTKVVP